ncbi:hypothetical protein [Acidimangrovimonas sediminis]|uniref:hypothetical protein n=1 Tax=Acidimangrovimonas sediminis TaxID=2056283 RepID=UPI000C804AB1|nr:hypothetical protein [Acidimangrovimonas sediminis]
MQLFIDDKGYGTLSTSTGGGGIAVTEAQIAGIMDDIAARKVFAVKGKGFSTSDRAADPVAAPTTITKTQFWLQARSAGLVTTEEAVTAVTTGTLPARLSEALSARSDAEQADLQITIATLTTISMGDTFMSFVAEVYDLDADAIDAFFTAAAAR